MSKKNTGLAVHKGMYSDRIQYKNAQMYHRMQKSLAREKKEKASALLSTVYRPPDNTIHMNPLELFAAFLDLKKKKTFKLQLFIKKGLV